MVTISAWLAGDKSFFFSGILENKNFTESEKQQFNRISVVDYAAYILICVGIAILLHSLGGLVGSLMSCGCTVKSKASICLKAYAVVVIIFVVLEILAAVLVLKVYRVDVENHVERYLKMVINKEYAATTNKDDHESSDKLVWDNIMTSLQCCGVHGSQDFPEGKIPLACCSSASSRICPSSGSPQLLQMTTGCYPLLLTATVPAVATTVAIVVLFQLCGVILTGCLSKLVKTREKEWYEMN